MIRHYLFVLRCHVLESSFPCMLGGFDCWLSSLPCWVQGDNRDRCWSPCHNCRRFLLGFKALAIAASFKTQFSWWVIASMKGIAEPQGLWLKFILCPWLSGIWTRARLTESSFNLVRTRMLLSSWNFQWVHFNVWSFNVLHSFKIVFITGIRHCTDWVTQIRIKYY